MQRPAIRLFSLIVVLAALASPAMALNVVNTSAPAYNYIFSTTGSITPTDMSSPVLIDGFLQSRVFQGQAGSPAAGKWCYEYRLDLRNVVGITYIPYATSVTVPFNSSIWQYDYNFDSVFTDQVLVVSSGGSGTIGLSSATIPIFTSNVKFTFSSPVSGGSYPGNGQSSYFFGLVSPYGPRAQYGTVQTDSGPVTVTVYAPFH